MKLEDIDKGNSFDWGKTSRDYAKYRDIYPEEFYNKILSLGLCRGVGASMSPETIAKWEEEHTQMMLKEAPETFNILHYVSYAELKVKK